MSSFDLRKKLTDRKPAKVIAFSFIVVILVGAFLLCLPISNQNGEWFSLIDSLFTATSAMCVTGLVVVVTVEQFTLFGTTVILILIQLGGLGVMTMIAIIMTWFSKKLRYTEKIVISEAINTETKHELGGFLKFIIRYVFIFEMIGAALIATRLIPEYGFWTGLYKSIFISISAFCNAGFDVIGAYSLAPYMTDFIMNFAVTSLIIIGGIGFTVWFDIVGKVKTMWKEKMSFSKAIRTLKTHTKMVLIVTVLLIVSGWIFILLAEINNPNSLQGMSFADQSLAAYFGSVTLRTAGFFTANPADMTLATKFIMCIFMYIGGSPGGTAGGIKTTTFGVIVLFIISELHGRENAVFQMRTIVRNTFRKAVTLLFVSLSLAVISILILCVTENASFIDIMFEVFSAMGTVGLSLGLTPNLTFVGKLVIIVLMFIGRIGPIAIVLSLSKSQLHHKHINEVGYPTANILIG